MRVSVGLFIVAGLGLLKYSGGSGVKERCDEFTVWRVELLPDFIEGGISHVADDYTAARSAEYVAIRVDVDRFCAEKIRFAV